jgi:hypothetical protein
MAITTLALHDVTRRSGQNRFCGPAVISALTGRSTQDCSRLIRRFTGKASVMGTGEKEIEAALNACGITLVPIPVPNRKVPDPKWSSGYRMEKPTLARWLEERGPTLRESVVLISAGHHWQLVRGGEFVCGLTKKVVPITHKKVRRRARVRAAWSLHAFGGPKELWPLWWQD